MQQFRFVAGWILMLPSPSNNPAAQAISSVVTVFS